MSPVARTAIPSARSNGRASALARKRTQAICDSSSRRVKNTTSVAVRWTLLVSPRTRTWFRRGLERTVSRSKRSSSETVSAAGGSPAPGTGSATVFIDASKTESTPLRVYQPEAEGWAKVTNVAQKSSGGQQILRGDQGVQA